MPYSALIQLRTRIDAELVKNILASYNIPAYIIADNLGGMYPFPLQPTPYFVSVMVSQDKLPEAKEIIKDMFRPEKVSRKRRILLIILILLLIL